MKSNISVEPYINKLLNIKNKFDTNTHYEAPGDLRVENVKLID